MPESWNTRLYRWAFNIFPAYRGSGGQVTYISADWREIWVRLPLSWQTRNYVGTIFGGSMYAAVDPFYMIMLIKNLGSAYTVWDKAARIRFKKPGRTTLFTRFQLEVGELEIIHRTLAEQPSMDRVYQVDLTDREGVVHASIEKTVYVARKKVSGKIIGEGGALMKLPEEFV